MSHSFKLKALALALVVATGTGAAALVHQERVHAATQQTLPVATETAAAPRLALPDLSDLVAANTAAVVNITVSMKRDAEEEDRDAAVPDAPDASPFGDFFRRFGVPNTIPGVPQQREQHGLGSGFIVSADGNILTNAHVVAGAREIVVKLNDRREFAGKVVGYDKLSDVALVKIDAKGLPTVKVGQPANLRVGQWVLAIGAPFGFDRTATQGIVSALHRNLPDDTYVPFIQTDVPINPGNSGGPLFDTAGNVVGINSQIFSRTGGYMGLSFAIPIDIAMDVAHQLETHGKVVRGWLGVSMQEVNQDLARSFGLDRPHGALVADVDPSGPAKRDGLAPGDIIVAFDGHAVESSSDLPPMVAASRPGDRKQVSILRDGKEKTLDVKVGQLREKGTVEVGQEGAGAAGPASLDLVVGDLDPSTRARAGVDHGVVVEQVLPGRAAAAGVRPGDILVSIDRKPIRDAGSLPGLLSELPRDRLVPLQVRRDGGTLFLALKPRRGSTG